MKSIKTYIIEGLVKIRGFKKACSSFEELIRIHNGLNAASCKDILIDFFKEVFKTTGSRNAFIYDVSKKYFKMPYSFNEKILEAAKNNDLLETAQKANKIYLYCKSKNGRNLKIMETGNGSIGRISTAKQEEVTCEIFNRYMDGYDDNKKQNIDEVCKNIANDVIGVDNDDVNDSWIGSWSLQIQTLIKCIKEFDANITNYRLVRYGADHVVAKAYKGMIDRYIKLNNNARKDAYDPTDIIIYNEANVNEVVSKLNGVDGYDSCEFIKNFKENIFENHLCNGVSLKKLHGSSGRYDYFNVGRSIIANVREIKNVKGYYGGTKYISIYCGGSFNFFNTVDASGEQYVDDGTIVLTMRTFGGGIVAVDVKKVSSGIAIGKCPANIWRNIIGVKKNAGIEDCKKALWESIIGVEKPNEREKKLDIGAESLNISAESLDKLTKIIKGAVKEGSECFPFILIH